MKVKRGGKEEDRMKEQRRIYSLTLAAASAISQWQRQHQNAIFTITDSGRQS
jgi:hypothetical protein